MSALIRRPVGGKRYKYNNPSNNNRCWETTPMKAYYFEDSEKAQKYIKEHKSDYGIDDEVFAVPDNPAQSYCLFCGTDSARHAGTERVRGSHVLLDIVCTYCNQKWQEKYSWQQLVIP